jgi:hypothetical protein
MSGIVFIAPLLAFLASLAVLALVRVMVGRYGTDRNSKSVGCGVALLVFPIACAFFFVWLPASTTHSGRKVSPQIANDHLLTFKIPPVATNVDYRTSFFAGLTDAADFDIVESEFLKWMARSNRKSISFSAVADRVEWADEIDRFDRDFPRINPVSAMLEGYSDDVQIKNGYYFDDYDPHMNDDSGLTVIYDSDKQRAYVRRTTF